MFWFCHDNEQRKIPVKTATISKSNHLTTALLGLLAFAAPACLSDPGDDGAPAGAPGSPTGFDLGSIVNKPAPVRPAMPSADQLAAKPKHSAMSQSELASLALTTGLRASPANLS